MAAQVVGNSRDGGQDWELSKENFQPLKAGRRPGGLRDNTAELRKQLVDEQRRRANHRSAPPCSSPVAIPPGPGYELRIASMQGLLGGDRRIQGRRPP